MNICKLCNKEYIGHFNSTLCSDICKKQARKNVQHKYFDKNIRKNLDMNSIQKIDENEIFKPIKNYDNYLISNYGRVYSRKKQNFLKQHINAGGYYAVNLCKSKHKTYLIHRLIALHFILNENPKEYKLVDHIDRNRTNNKIENLRWCDDKINSNNSSRVLNRKGGILKTKDKIKGKIYYGWRVYYYENDICKTKRFKNENEAKEFYQKMVNV